MRTNDEMYDSIRALKEFENDHPYIVDNNRITRFIGSVVRKRKGYETTDEGPFVIHWDYNGQYGPDVIIDAPDYDDRAKLYYNQFCPAYQFYVYDKHNRVLRIKHDEGLYEVVIVALRGRED